VREGRWIKAETDTNFDNKPEIIEEYTDGVLSGMSWYHESTRNLWKKAPMGSRPEGNMLAEQGVPLDRLLPVNSGFGRM